LYGHTNKNAKALVPVHNGTLCLQPLQTGKISNQRQKMAKNGKFYRSV